ncbi:14-3-3 protein gamma-like [Hemicordylus capensis]|uniref:14-3-3 protein gamma-like n=1 Tax=Hemicordylus capensis TaxID=884348 RepID=UPI0023030D2C|nr:14-3-3 protein gamma-like [Hemicordylus capensis]
MLSRKQLVQAAQLAEQCGRYKDMATAMKQLVVEGKEPLTHEEKTLLSEAHKLLIQEHCSSWRRLKCSVEQGVGKQKEQAQAYREAIKKELEAQCWEILSLLDNVLLKHCSESDDESRAFYLIMKGDNYRYLAEVALPDAKETLVKSAEKAYGEAQELSQKYMEPTHPLALALALNYSMLYYEVLNNPQQATKLAKAAFDKAIAGLETLSLEFYKESTVIMQHLRDSIVQWTSDQQPQVENNVGELEG